ncbi:MAG: LssY C-terminal domain-containing protein [Kiritimatiellae bacterium]|nr:LssY C-terminal domain-containing protein [Kiritimatiellia bacterium]
MRSSRATGRCGGWIWMGFAVVLLLLGGGCASFEPAPMTAEALLSKAQTQTSGAIEVSVAWLSDREMESCFDLPLSSAGIQPIWIRVTNRSEHPCWLLPAVTDPHYFSATEVLQKVKSRGYDAARKNRVKAVFLEEEMIEDCIPSGDTRQGFIYATRQPGMRRIPVMLLSPGRLDRFLFLLGGKTLRSDHRWVNFEGLYSPEERVPLTAETLYEAIRALPALTENARGTATGDPLNLVLIGSREEVFSGLIGAGWNETEALNPASAVRTVTALISGTPYRFSPVSPLYVFGRRQDMAFQKIRQNIQTRLHMRLWLTPCLYEGRPLWLGQISRDIGIRMTTKSPSLTTHLIDPDVDGDRWYLIQELLRQQCLARIGFVEGGPQFTPLNPGCNLTGDAYYTDGLRAVLLLSGEPMAVDDVAFWPWQFPSRGGLSQPGDYLRVSD